MRQLLRQGKIVVLPSESVYYGVARALDSEAVAKLADLADPHQPLSILLRHPNEMRDWVASLAPVGSRLIRNFWPGPLTIMAPRSWTAGLFDCLPQDSQKLLAKQGSPAFTILHHEAMQYAGQVLGEPLAVAPLPGNATAEAAAATCGADVGLVYDAGPTQFGKPSTVVRLQGKGCYIEREGAILRSEIEAATTCHILFVCTGNTCRSPLSEAICAKLLTDRLGCSQSELLNRGFSVQSAGLAAIMGAEASPEAVVVAKNLGADLSQHRSQSLNIDLLAQADFLFTMTGSHFRMLYSLLGGVGPTPRLLAPNGEDVVDPIGGTPEAYRECALQIQEHLKSHLPEILES